MDAGKTELSPEAILIAEFEYARGTALQANEDRARVASYFLATGGSIVAATLGVTGEQGLNPYSALAFAALFGLLVYVGWMTIEQLVRLRLAWRESCLAMNQVKSVFVAAHPTVQDGLRWRNTSLPSAYSAASVSSLLSRVVAAIIGLATMAGVAILWPFGTDALAAALDRSMFLSVPWTFGGPLVRLIFLFGFAAAAGIMWFLLRHTPGRSDERRLFLIGSAASALLLFIDVAMWSGVHDPVAPPVIGALVAAGVGLLVGLSARHRYVERLRAADAAEHASSSGAA